MIVQFWVPGVPAPGGSKNAYVNRHTGRAVLVDAGKNNAGWKQRVAVFASQAMAGRAPMDGPLRLTMAFHMPRPKRHFHVGKKVGLLRMPAPYFHTSKPDATKLTRSTEDACKGILWVDDSAVSRQAIDKVYENGRGPGVLIEVEQL